MTGKPGGEEESCPIGRLVRELEVPEPRLTGRELVGRVRRQRSGLPGRLAAAAALAAVLAALPLLRGPAEAPLPPGPAPNARYVLLVEDDERTGRRVLLQPAPAQVLQ